jgi:hypothetical protein
VSNLAEREIIKPSSEELSRDIQDVVSKLYQSWDNRLDFPPTKLPERYLRNELAIVLQLQCYIGGTCARYSILIAHENLGDFGVQRCVHRNFPSARLVAQHEFPVFIDNIHVVKDTKGTVERVGGFVWLKPFNEVAHSGICDSLYFSFIFGNTVFIDWLNINNWKADIRMTSSVPGFVCGELPNGMIETGPQVMDNLTRKHTEPKRDDPLFVVFDSLKGNLGVVLGDDLVFAALKKGVDFELEITDVLVGPF